MTACKRCGKGGFFHKVNEHGLCVDCARIEALEFEARKIQEEINNFKILRAADETAYNEIKEKKEILYNEIAEKAKKDPDGTIPGKRIVVNDNGFGKGRSVISGEGRAARPRLGRNPPPSPKRAGKRKPVHAASNTVVRR